MMPRGKGFEINQASVLGFRAIGEYAKNMLENELNQAAFEVKERKFALDLLDYIREQLGEVVVDWCHNQCVVVFSGIRSANSTFAKCSKW